jgi:hypothetical protein
MIQMDASGFALLIQQVTQAVAGVEGWLSLRETEFLALAAACPTTEGAVLEIGSYRGRSTIALALAVGHGAARFGEKPSRLIAVDPMLDDDPLMHRPLPHGMARQTFEENLRRAGIRSLVEFHQAFSYDLAPSWDLPLRLLWIDGDHHYASTKQDFDLFSRFLADGAILAMHDVLSRYDGCIRVFSEDVLTSPHFGAAGLCGSIGWSQFWKTPRHDRNEIRQKQRLLRKLAPLVPIHCQSRSPRGLAKLHYQWLRSRVPHRAINPQRWRQTVQAA